MYLAMHGNPLKEAASNFVTGKSSLADATLSLLAMFGGLGIGLLGLTWYENKYMKRPFIQPQGSLEVREQSIIRVADGEHDSIRILNNNICYKK